MEIKTSFSKSAPQPGKHFRNRSITSLDISNLLLVQRPRAPFPRDSIANTLLRTGHCHISASQSESSFGREIVQLPFKYHIVVVFNKLSSWGKSLRKRNRLSVVAPQIYRFLESSGRLNEGGEFLFYFDAIKDAQAVMYLGRGDYDSYQIARNDLEDSGWLSPEIEINSLDKIPLGEYLQAGISKMKSTDWA